MLECEVDGYTDERWGKNDGDDLGFESVLVPRIVSQRDASAVTWLFYVSVSHHDRRQQQQICRSLRSHIFALLPQPSPSFGPGLT